MARQASGPTGNSVDSHEDELYNSGDVMMNGWSYRTVVYKLLKYLSFHLIELECHGASMTVKIGSFRYFFIYIARLNFLYFKRSIFISYSS